MKMTGRNRVSSEELSAHALRIRAQVVRMVGRNGQGYVQQGLGAADIFTQVWFAEARLEVTQPDWPGRDRIFLSTAHNSALFHATLAERGLIPEAGLESYTKDGSPLEINVSERLGQVVEATCGSLGQGLSVAAGVAMSHRRRGGDQRCFVILGDGELQEGSNWEAALTAGHRRLENLTLIVDRNRLQQGARTEDTASLDPLDDKWRAFGWHVEMVDGHDHQQLLDVLSASPKGRGKPLCVIANTVKGNGVSFMHDNVSWHHGVPNKEQYEQAMRELV